MLHIDHDITLPVSARRQAPLVACEVLSTLGV